MPTTPTYALPYPAPTDPADVPHDIQALATATDTAVKNAVAPAPVAGRAYVTAAFTPPANTNTRMPVDHVDYDLPGGAWNTTTHQYTIATAGIYHIVAQIIVSSTPSGDIGCILSLQTSGVERSNGQRGGRCDPAGYYVGLLTDTLNLAAGAAVSVYINTTAAYPLYVGSPATFNFISIHQIK